MSKKLRLGAVGIGGIWHGCHAKPWLNHPDVEIVGVCDIVKAKADKFAAEQSIPHSFQDYHDLLKLDLDMVDICTPNLFHSEIAVAALKRGCHVFTEKPDAISPKEAMKMADAAKKSGKVLMAMRNNRWAPSTRFLKQYIDAGNAGEIYTGRCGWQRRRGIPGKGGWFTTKAISGGGPLIDLGVHFIDVAVWLMGNPRPVAVSGATYCKFAQASGPADSVHANFGESKQDGTFDVEDLAIGFIRFDNGSSLQIEFSWASNIEEETIFAELRGTKAGCCVKNGVVKVFSETGGNLIDILPKLPPAHKYGDHGANLWHFADVVRKKAQPINTPEDGVYMIKILAAIYASAKEGKEIRL